MNEQTNQLLRELAEKLGTTTEYLWQVLIKQAHISGTVNLIAIAIWIAVLVWSWRLTARKVTNRDWDAFAWFVWCIFAGALVLVAGVNAEMIVASLFNPEYWALKQILK